MNVLVFDKSNKQIHYQHMARNIETGELEIGYIVVEKPWYSHENMWKYYLVKNQHVTDATGKTYDIGLQKTEVDHKTIKPYNQVAEIEWNKEHNIPTKLVNALKGEEMKEIAFVGIDDEIPYSLWDEV